MSVGGRFGLLVLALLAGAPGVSRGERVARRWTSPSRLTLREASQVFYRQAEGQPVATEALFEAEKFLRTDGGVSPSGYLLTGVRKRLLTDRIHDRSIRVRVLPPVLHWLESRETPSGVRLRGETVELVVLEADPGLAATLLYHRTIVQGWRSCGGTLCVAENDSPLREEVSYALSLPEGTVRFGSAASSPLLRAARSTAGVRARMRRAGVARTPEGACEPPADETLDVSEDSFRRAVRHVVARTRPGETVRISCAFVVGPAGARARFSYAVEGGVAAPPAAAARSAIVNNPLEFALFE